MRTCHESGRSGGVTDRGNFCAAREGVAARRGRDPGRDVMFTPLAAACGRVGRSDAASSRFAQRSGYRKGNYRRSPVPSQLETTRCRIIDHFPDFLSGYAVEPTGPSFCSCGNGLHLLVAVRSSSARSDAFKFKESALVEGRSAKFCPRPETMLGTKGGASVRKDCSSNSRGSFDIQPPWDKARIRSDRSTAERRRV